MRNLSKSIFGFAAVLFAVSVAGVTTATAQTDIYIRGAGKLIPIALPQLCIQGGDPETAREIPKTVARDLELSGFFEVQSPNSFVESPGKCDGGTPAYSDWTVIGTEGLMKGVISAGASGVRVQLFLHDVSHGKMVLGKEYEGTPSQLSKIAHRFANEIMKFYTGEYGPFGTQMSFSSKVGRFKELFVMDMDGSNVRQLTNEKGLAVSSHWNPNGNSLLYTSYRNRVPELFKIDIASRAVQQLTRGSALELGANYSPDSGKILLSITEGRDSDIVLMNPDGSISRRLTPPNGAIDVSPVFSPDGSRIAFCSNRAGGPQIYIMGSDGSGAKRVSFVTSNYCTSPAWSPKGDKIAFVCRADGGFQMFTTDPDGGNALQLTSIGSNEDPSWSPDGRYLAFASNASGGLYHINMMRADGAAVNQLTNGRTDDTQASWGPPVS